MSSRTNISKARRFSVLSRDKFTCQCCGRSAPAVVLEIDHIDPVSRGGKNDISNLVTLCTECNLGKSDADVKELKEHVVRNNMKLTFAEGMPTSTIIPVAVSNEDFRRLEEIRKFIADHGCNEEFTLGNLLSEAVPRFIRDNSWLIEKMRVSGDD